MKTKNKREQEIKSKWKDLLKSQDVEQTEFDGPIRNFVFNSIINAPVMPDIKPMNEDEFSIKTMGCGEFHCSASR